MTVDLSTEYLGLKLKNPVVVAACPLTESADNLRRFEDSGAAAAVLPSLFEEQIEHEDVELSKAQEFGTESYAEALSFFPEPAEYRVGTDSYLKKIEDAKKAVSIPIIGSLNGVSVGGWTRYAKMIQDAGADALELNIYMIAADLNVSGEQIEQQCVDLVESVCESISIPLAVKIGPYFSSPGHMANRLVGAGANGLVLFNRFLQPDIDLDEMEIVPRLKLSSSYELLVPLRWIAILHGRVSASLAVTTGIHDSDGLVKAIAAGADVGMVASLLYRKKLDAISDLLASTTKWLEENEYASVEQLKGSMSQANCPQPAAFERGNYMKALTSFTSETA